mmetsp:Transcript_13825/g.33378  ORF Transcript_13825/g.33378 Transcript_13825/m.33378 type:complete len:204 (+) Transcript_13825:1292-1903(+)
MFCEGLWHCERGRQRIHSDPHAGHEDFFPGYNPVHLRSWVFHGREAGWSEGLDGQVHGRRRVPRPGGVQACGVRQSQARGQRCLPGGHADFRGDGFLPVQGGVHCGWVRHWQPCVHLALPGRRLFLRGSAVHASSLRPASKHCFHDCQRLRQDLRRHGPVHLRGGVHPLGRVRRGHPVRTAVQRSWGVLERCVGRGGCGKLHD